MSLENASAPFMNSTQVNNITLQLDDPYLTPEEIAQVVFLSFLFLIGTFGNILIVATLIYKNAVFKSANIFIMNLAVADILVSGINVPIMMANIISKSSILDHGWLCDAAGFMVTTSCICSINNLTVIAANRYVGINSFRGIATPHVRSIFVVIGVWLWSIGISIPGLLGWNSFSYDEKMKLCSWDDRGVLSYRIFIVVLGFCVPAALVAFFYVSLFRNVHKMHRRMSQKMTGSGRNDYLVKRTNQDQILIKMLAVTTGCLYICWSPYCVICIIHSDNINAGLKLFAGWLGISNSSLNFIIYGVMNNFFRRGYKELLCTGIPRLFCGR